MKATELELHTLHSDYVLRMIADPDLSGDTLLFAVAALSVYFERQLAGRSTRLKLGPTNKRIIEVTGWRGTSYGEIWRAVKADLPRYDPKGVRDRITCSGLMVRREGLCGKSTHTTASLRDPQTGEFEIVGGCSRHWPEVHTRVHDATRAWRANGSPQPANNAGGALLKYFNREYIEAMYEWVGGARYDRSTPPPPPATPRPSLRVINGGRNF